MPEPAPGPQADLEVHPVADCIVVAGHSHLGHLGEDNPFGLLEEGSRPGLVVDPMIRKKLVTDQNLL